MKCKNKRKKVNLAMLKTPAFKKSGKSSFTPMLTFSVHIFDSIQKKKWFTQIWRHLWKFWKLIAWGIPFTTHDKCIRCMTNLSNIWWIISFFFSVFPLEMPWRFLFFYFFYFFRFFFFVFPFFAIFLFWALKTDSWLL